MDLLPFLERGANQRSSTKNDNGVLGVNLPTSTKSFITSKLFSVVYARRFVSWSTKENLKKKKSQRASQAIGSVMCLRKLILNALIVNE